jgi:hypothetical protein
VQTAGAQLALDASTAALKGSKVRLGSGNGDSAQSAAKPAVITRVLMTDSQGKPRANARVRLEKKGEERMTVLDADGRLELIGDDASYHATFPDDPVSKE